MVRSVEHQVTYDSEASIQVHVGMQPPHVQGTIDQWVEDIARTGDYPTVSMAGFTSRSGLQDAVDSRAAESIRACPAMAMGVCEAEVHLEGVDEPSELRKFVGTCVIRDFRDKEEAERREAICQDHLNGVFGKVVKRASDATSRLAGAEAAFEEAETNLNEAKKAL